MDKLAERVNMWYAEDPSRERIIQRVLSGNAGFSLREIDYFVTNIAAKKSVVYLNEKTGRVVDVNRDYKNTLKCFHKKAFDSFQRRGDKLSDGDIKQRNFFKWAIENGVVDYVQNNIDEIAKQMPVVRDCKKKKKATKTDKPLKPRKRKRDVASGCATIINRPIEIETKRL